MEKVAHFISFETAENGRINQNQKSIPDSIGDKNQKFLNWFILLGILLFAAFLRLYRIQDYMTFLGDEGRDVLIVKDIIEGIESLFSGNFSDASKKLTLLGPTASVGGFFLGPIYYYFMTPFLWLFNYNPVGPAIMVALFGTATVFLVYKIGREFFGTRVGLFSAFLYSISPLVIAYSRSSWNPNLMPFFSLLTLYVLYRALKTNKIKLFILCGFLFGILMQIHYLTLFLGVIAAIYVFLIRVYSILYRHSSVIIRVLKDYFYILIGFLVGWLPFLAFEVRHGFPNIQSIISFVFNPGEEVVKTGFLGIIYNAFFRLFARLVVNFPPPEQVILQESANIAIWYWLTLLLGTISVFLLLKRFLVGLNNKEEFRKMSLLILWLIVGIGLFGFYKKPIYDYYFGFMFPLPFMLVGLTISSFYTNTHEYVRYIVDFIFKREVNRGRHEFTRIKLVGKILATSIFAGLVWVNLQGIPFRYQPNRQLAQVEEISRFVIEKADNKPFNFALITGGNSDHAYRYFFTLWDKSPVTIQNSKEDPQRKTVTDQLLIVCEDLSCKPLGNSLWEVAGFGRAEIEKEWDVSVVKVFKLRHYKGKE